MNYNWYDFIGNIGVALILVAYLMLQAKKISSEKYLYSLMNGIGALLIIVSLIFDFNLSAFIIEFFWLLISIYGFIKTFNSKK
jgi:hypothetical protein